MHGSSRKNSRRLGSIGGRRESVGGDGVVGINAFIGAHDGHTLLYMPTSSFVAHPYQHEKMPYDPSELSPVARDHQHVAGWS